MDVAAYLDAIEPVIQSINELCWSGDNTPIDAAKFEELRDEAKRLEPLFIQVRQRLEVHGRIIEGRMRTRDRLSKEKRLLIDRLNKAELSLRGFLSMVEFVETGKIRSAILHVSL